MTCCGSITKWIHWHGGKKTSPASQGQRVKILYVADTWSVPHLAVKANTFALTASGEIRWRILYAEQSSAMQRNGTGKLNLMLSGGI